MLRLPPSPEQPWERVVHALQQQPYDLDEFVRARLERNLVDAWRSRGARAVAVRERQGPRRFPSRTAWFGSLAVSAAVGVLFGWYALRDHQVITGAPPEVLAHFDLVIDDGAVQSGYLSEGQILESGQHGHIEVALDQSRVDVAPDTRVRFERMAREELRLSLIKGRVEVAFHPAQRGEQHMSIETRSARVMVVGTQFAVDSDAEGNTKVSVNEGVVQVVPRGEGETRFVRAGERLDVPVQAERERAQAVRASIESRLRAENDEPEAQHAVKAERAELRTRDGQRLRCADESTPDERLEAARVLLLHGKHSAARERLQKIAKKNTLPTSTRVEALVLTAESYTAQGQIPKATDAYRAAFDLAPHHPAAHNALFALARLIERYTDDVGGAGAVYREYLQRAPRGALAPQAHEALCRLGDASACEP